MALPVEDPMEKFHQIGSTVLFMESNATAGKIYACRLKFIASRL